MKALTDVCKNSQGLIMLLALLVCAVVVRCGMVFAWYPHVADTLLHF